MQKTYKAQVTLFVIIALVIVGSIILITYLKNQRVTPIPLLLESDVNYLNSFVGGCVEEKGKEALFIAGMQGGYIYPRKFLSTSGVDISYLYYFGEDLLSLQFIETQFEHYVEENLPACLERFERADLIIESEDDEVDAKVKIEEDVIYFDVEYPIKISREETTAILGSPFNVRLSIRFGRIYNITKGIINKEIEDPERIDITYLLDIENNNEGIDLMVLPYSNDTIIYTITDNKSRIYDDSYIFMFANKFKNETIL